MINIQTVSVRNEYEKTQIETHMCACMSCVHVYVYIYIYIYIPWAPSYSIQTGVSKYYETLLHAINRRWMDEHRRV